MVSAKPAQGAEPVQCSGAAKIKPPFEMGVDNFVVSAIPIPLLAILSLLLNKSIIFTLGICITLIAIAAIWIIYGIFRKCRKNLWRAFGFALLVLIPVPIAITHISAYCLPQVQYDFTSDVFNSGITLALSLVCFGVDYLLYHRKGDVTGKK